MTALEPGDLLFFKGDTARLIDRLIMWRTKSVYVHVEVVLTVAPQATSIGALTGGVNIHAVPGNYSEVARLGATLAQTPERLALALADLAKRAGDTYGWGDIVSQALELLPGHPSVSFDRSEDCSDLATQFLLAAGYILPFGVDPDRATPGSMASWFPLSPK